MVIKVSAGSQLRAMKNRDILLLFEVYIRRPCHEYSRRIDERDVTICKIFTIFVIICASNYIIFIIARESSSEAWRHVSSDAHRWR